MSEFGRYHRYIYQSKSKIIQSYTYICSILLQTNEIKDIMAISLIVDSLDVLSIFRQKNLLTYRIVI